MKELGIDTGTVREKIVKFIKTEVRKAGFGKVVIGLSGGVDSSLLAHLSVEALGKENVIGILLPYKESNLQSIQDAREVVKNLGIESLEVDITEMVDAYFKKFPEANKIRRGNKLARERMSILYDLSQKYQALVLGSSNKTEWFLGYFTQYGDAGCGLAPLLDLYKTQVRQLAKAVGVPEHIIDKVPTADLWPGQTDEGEMGFTYEEVDRLLYLMFNKNLSDIELKTAGFKEDFIKEIKERIKKYEYKRRLPLFCQL